MKSVISPIVVLENNVKKPYTVVFSHGKFVPEQGTKVPESLQVMERYEYYGRIYAF